MLYNFCTIVTADYAPYAYNLADNLVKLNSNAKLFVLVCSDGFEGENNSHLEFINYHSLNDNLAKQIKDKYFDNAKDNYRWSMKPVFMRHLFDKENLDKLIYIDCDIHFFNSYTFLFNLLDENNILLSPHFRSKSYSEDPINYILQFTNGIFNGGFVGANKEGLNALEWWAERCLEICEVNTAHGQFVDQSHLNLLPVYFEKIHIIKHEGCNVANWNERVCKRELLNDQILINNKYPIIFIHFTKSTLNGILNCSDNVLNLFLEEYNTGFKKFGIDLVALYQLPPEAGNPIKTPLHRRVINYTKSKIKRILLLK